MSTDRSHPIRIVALRTGLSPHRIRIWERRYHAVLPSRTPTNRRSYSEADVDRLGLLGRAVQLGRSISQVAGMPTESLRALLDTDDVAARWVESALHRAGKSCPARGVVEACLAAVDAFDARRLEDVLQRARVNLGRTTLLDEVVGPLFERVGELWRRGALRTSQEHLVSATLRNLLASMIAPAGDAGAPGLVATTPSGQVHEFGALLAAATAASEGWNVTYLGPCLPAEEIAAAAARSRARAVALSIVHPADDPRLAPELQSLQRLLPRGTQLLAGGRAVRGYAAALEAAGARIVSDLAGLRAELERLRAA
jgi:MerR family transcriptional regulator, light-induced transcriptional regulator